MCVFLRGACFFIWCYHVMCGIYFLKFSGAPSDAEMLGN